MAEPGPGPERGAAPEPGPGSEPTPAPSDQYPPPPDRDPRIGYSQQSPQPQYRGRPPRRRRSPAYRLIMVAGFAAAALLAGGIAVLAVGEIQDIVEAQDRGPTLPSTDGRPLGAALDRQHEGIAVDWEAGPNLGEDGLDRGSRVEEAPGIVMVDTMLMEATGTGTGIILTAEGLAITNYHVVENSSEVTITVADTSEQYTATVLGRDSQHDVAVLQIEDASALRTASLTTVTPSRGDLSAAVGNGGGQGFLTAVTGEVTGLDEAIVASSGVPDDEARLSGLIETSADVVPGYSGGPLVDGDGQIVGITTAASQGEGTEEVDGYAIPMHVALQVVEQVLSGEETETVSIGVDGALGVVVGTEEDRAVVIEVSPDSAAEDLGLEVGDIVTAVDGQPVSSAAELSQIVNDHNVGDVVGISWTTESGRERTGEATLQEAVVN